MSKNYAKDTYMIQGMITGLFLGGISIPIMVMCSFTAWIGFPIGLFPLFGALVGMLIHKNKINRKE